MKIELQYSASDLGNAESRNFQVWSLLEAPIGPMSTKTGGFSTREGHLLFD